MVGIRVGSWLYVHHTSMKHAHTHILNDIVFRDRIDAAAAAAAVVVAGSNKIPYNNKKSINTAAPSPFHLYFYFNLNVLQQ